ncbi:MAG: helix-turn-helix transcriptional regulator [Pirellulaceae bacterium]|nr:helix-turn-helix transcriptional regulator [Planctomycetales bacterium]
MPRVRVETFSDQLRAAILNSGRPRSHVCADADIDPSHLHRFVHGTGRLTNDTIDRLAKVLNLSLVVEE